MRREYEEREESVDEEAQEASAKGKQSQVEIRMYNVGFGDSFLVRMPTEEGERRVLVDCGFHSQGKGKFSDAELVQQIKAGP